MAKNKIKTGVPNKHLHARISYLQQAEAYLTRQGEVKSRQSANETDGHEQTGGNPNREIDLSISPSRATNNDESKAVSSPTLASSGGLPRQLSLHLTQVAQKSQMRLHPSIKHQICKRCSSVLDEGITCHKYMENLSKGGRKPHADVLVVECHACGAQKRWPVGAKRQKKKNERLLLQKSGGDQKTQITGNDTNNVPAGEERVT